VQCNNTKKLSKFRFQISQLISKIEFVILNIMSITKTFTASIHKEEEIYVASCVELGTVSQGSSIEEALQNLKEATELY
jgi:hypothetical protein